MALHDAKIEIRRSAGQEQLSSYGSSGAELPSACCPAAGIRLPVCAAKSDTSSHDRSPIAAVTCACCSAVSGGTCCAQAGRHASFVAIPQDATRSHITEQMPPL